MTTNAAVSQSNRDIVGEVVSEFVTKEWPFTAFNITTEAKARGADDRHRNLKAVVHEIFVNSDMPGYTRENKFVKEANANAWYYTKSDDEVEDEDDDGLGDLSPTVDSGVSDASGVSDDLLDDPELP